MIFLLSDFVDARSLCVFPAVLYFPLLAENKGARAHAMCKAIQSFFDKVVSKRVPAGQAPYVIDFIVLDKRPPQPQPQPKAAAPAAAGSAAPAAADAKPAATSAAAAPAAPARASLVDTTWDPACPFEVIVGELNPFHDYTGAGVGSGSEVGR